MARSHDGGDDREGNDHVSVAGIKCKYGMTGKFVEMLGEPDKIMTNPHYKSAPPMKLYRVDRVEQEITRLKEANPEFFERMKRRREAAGRAVATKRESTSRLTTEILASLVIEDYDASKIPGMAERQHYWHEIETYGDIRHDWHGGINAEIAFIRHNLTNYHDVLDKIRGKVGSGDAYDAIKKDLNEKIAGDYATRLGEPVTCDPGEG